ncbi:MAG: SAM-dependent chlorinase/fluorinase [Deltaproteobacteria bacterium]|jgi:S-adenosylmethionine hydrolase|nr:SAM-dependent chlorinase/fluorinase [Deltaproteobacteria bacterium]
MPVITLLTDFGGADEYVGVMKGVMLSICPSVTVVDISHQLEPQDIVQAAYMVPAYFHYFPEGTIHIVVVDPGVGSQRAVLAVHFRRHFFIAPDNGVLSLLLRDQKSDTVIEVDKSEYFLKPLSATFHGRDIFAALAAHMACGTKIESLGSRRQIEEIVYLNDLTGQITESGELIGKIVSIDRFGNLISNIEALQLRDFCRSQPSRRIHISIGALTIRGMAKTYADAASGTPLALIGSRGCLEIALNCANAQKQLKARKGDRVRITLL